MFLSAFTFARNTDKLYYPIKECISSVLPIADEVIVALGEGDADDKTEEIIRGIGDEKIKIYKRQWDLKLFANSQIFAHETTFALNQCKGTWCIYLQADEVLHEDDLETIVGACKKYENDLSVDGMLFSYVHFWGDYEHLVETHGLHRNEIRVVRNGIGAYSYKDALSFRKGSDEKLNVIKIPARIFHYGYMRPPELMSAKSKVHDALHSGNDLKMAEVERPGYDWGPLGGLKKFNGTHPKVMTDWIRKFNWATSLNFNKPGIYEQSPHRHLRPKYRFMTWLERNFNNNEEIFGFKNYRLIKRG
jgi:hypothetical protein